MMLQIPGLLDKAAVAALRRIIDTADWVDGNVTSGPQAALAKRNRQLPEESAAAHEARSQVLAALSRSALFMTAALPLKVYPPLFNRYGPGEGFGIHIDNAVRLGRGSDFRLRSDLSATLFLTEPEDYDGGELIIEGSLGVQSVKLAAGDMLLYPASTLHRVTPVTRGERLASFFWVQSMVRDDGQRQILFDLDRALQTVAADRGQDDPAIILLTGTWHNLLRRWADT
jgi:PKHD-type hydroxylase